MVYKRYKIMQSENLDKLEEIEEEAQELVQNFHGGSARTEESDRQIKSSFELQNELGLLFNKKI